ncbi:MAG: AAA family ATPase [Thermoplasmataceae archaeon]
MKKVKPSQLKSILSEVAVRGRLPVMVWGAPGIGKSQIVRDTAAGLGMSILDLRLNYYEETDFLGIPVRTERGMEFVKYARFPRNGRGIWFLDEITHARTSTQGLVFQLINDGMIEDYTVPEGWRYFVGSSNLPSHRSISNAMPSGLYSRFTGGHYELIPDVEDWTQWAIANSVDDRIISFVTYMEHNDQKPWLFRQENSYPLTPRIWSTGVNYALRNLEGEIRDTAIMGMIGEENGLEFLHYLKLAAEMPDPLKIIDGDYEWIRGNHDASLWYLLAGSLARVASQDSGKITGCLKALLQMKDEYAALGFSLIRNAVERKLLVSNEFLASNMGRFREIMGVSGAES